MSTAAAISIYRRAFSKALGEGSYNPFSYSNDITDANFTKTGLAAGQRFVGRLGGASTTLRLVRAIGTLAAGNAVKVSLGAAGRTGTFSAATADGATTTSNFNAYAGVNYLSGGFVSTLAGTGLNQMRPILDHSLTGANDTLTVAERDWAHNIASTLVADIFAPTPDATTTFSIYVPWEVIATATAADYAVGIALNTVTAGNWTLILEEGPVQALCIGATNALIAGEIVVPSATAGALCGRTAAGMTAIDAAHKNGFCTDAYAGAALLRTVHFEPSFRP